VRTSAEHHQRGAERSLGDGARSRGTGFHRRAGVWPPEAAEAGSGHLAAGPKTAVERCEPLWEAMGQKLLVIGEQPSKANVRQADGNFLIATVLESLGEALAFARKSESMRRRCWIF